MVRERVLVFAWYCNFKCLAPDANVVVPLAELARGGSPYDLTTLSSARLITVATPEGDRVAACIRRKEAPVGATSLERPIAEGQCLPFTDKLFISTSSEEDKELLARQ